jgi:uncharacterized protein with NAD-binding domain and iron-sulfur cluster
VPDAATKVAVLGGGAGALTAAFELTRPEREGRYEVTVIQPGWRLGGKGASGRNMADGRGARIEEHGLHLWFGFYANAFRVMREAYAALPEQWPIRDVEDAFKGCRSVVLYDRVAGEWHSYAAGWPEREGKPWEVEELPGFWDIAEDATRWALSAWGELRDDLVPGDLAPPGEELLIEPALELAKRLAGWLQPPDWLGVFDPMERFLDLVRGFRDWVWDLAGGDERPRVRLFLTTLDAFVAIATGIVRDRLLERGFDSVDDEEWAAWLVRHGASESTVGATPEERSPVLRAVYDLAFGYPEGKIEKANVAAGTATNDLLRLMFTYRGHLFYKMRAGMGDIVFAPLYQVLKDRGVSFEYFSAVSRLGVSDDGQRIEEIDVVRQAELVAGRGEYDPLVPVRELPCWPSEPLWDQLAAADRLPGTDFEGQVDPLGRGAETLRLGEDFDQVVLGIPVGAHREVCGELMQANDRFRAMVEGSATVRTQAFQLWLRHGSEELGWEHGTDSVAGSYVEPLDTYCDMSDLLEAEDWAEDDGVQSIAYLCGVLDDEHGAPGQEATDRAKQNALEFLRGDAGPLWPGAVADPGAALRWELLADAGEGDGEARFEAQYWRANTSAWERYVLSPAGSLAKRLTPGESGFENVVLAGDWTKNGIDGGCVEAAVTSGVQAAAAMLGEPSLCVGEDTRWLDPARTGKGAPEEHRQVPAALDGAEGMPAYVEFGGQATNPGPFRCEGGRLRGFVLRGDAKRIEDLVRRTLTEPTGGAIEYRPLGGTVMLMVGEFERITSTVAPWDSWGSARETQASLWIPMVAGTRKGERFDIDRFCMAVPYALVDNPMSYSGGREDYGYAKTMGIFEPADGLGDRVAIKAYGGSFSPGAQAAWLPLLEIAPAGDEHPEGVVGAFEDAAGFVRGLAAGAIGVAGDLGHSVAGGIADLIHARIPEVADVSLVGDFVDSLIAGRGRQVLLKQFRDAVDGKRACYQAVVEAPVKMTRVRGRPSLRSWEVTIHDLDSHPIRKELGLSSQRAAMALDLELEFVCGQGVTIAER